MSAGIHAVASASARPRVQDRVCLVLALAGIAAAGFGAFLSIAPNRLADGRPLHLWQIGGAGPFIIAVPLLLLLAAPFMRDAAWRSGCVPIASIGLVLAALLVAGVAAKAHLSADEPARRISLGGAFWILVGVGLLAAFQSAQRRASTLIKIAVMLTLAATTFLIAASGMLDALSLAREFEAQRSVFVIALLRHISLVATALPLAILVATPLILTVAYGRRGRATIFVWLNLLQTIPSIALFGLLIAPLSFLSAHVALLRAIGIDGIGAAPTIVALILYALLPLVRSADAGLRNVPADVREAARGMGLTPRAIFFRIDLPLALPALISGLRVVTVQSIGLATVAALIGAGGLGTFVFQGIGEYALDLVLVGALPTILLAVTADAFFQIGLARLRSRP